MHPNEIAINDYVDDALAGAERADVERHLAECAECRALVRDLTEIRRTAASLDLREPPVRAWTRIERAIKLDEDARGRPAEARTDRGRAETATRQPSVFDRLPRPRYAWLAAAAVLVIATVVGLQFIPGMRTRRLPGATTPHATPSATSTTSTTSMTSISGGEAAQAVEYELRAAEEHYEKAISGLEAIARSEQSALDPRTAATLQKNLAVIDQAINESREALRTQPASEPAQQSLMENFRTKIGLLQDTVALINEMRKGNEAGAARIVSGLKQKGD